jgi:hypothetical protein
MASCTRTDIQIVRLAVREQVAVVSEADAVVVQPLWM